MNKSILLRNEHFYAKKSDKIKDETHFVIECELYKNDRKELFRSIVQGYPGFADMIVKQSLYF